MTQHPETPDVLTPTAAGAPAPPVPGAGRRRRRRKAPVMAAISMVWLGLIVLLAIAMPILPVADPAVSDYTSVRTVPFADMAHPLGTDHLGRDLLARTISGARVSLLVGFGSAVIAVVLGTILGAAAGYFGGLWDRVVSWMNDVMLAFPMLVAMIALTTFMGPSLWTITVGLGVTGAPLVSRIARSASMGYANRDFVDAAKVSGASSFRILLRDILPNIALIIVPFAITLVALAITGEGALSFLGLGVPPPTTSWGGIMNDGQAELRAAPHIVFVPAAAMCVTLLSIAFIADWISRWADDREARV